MEARRARKRARISALHAQQKALRRELETAQQKEALRLQGLLASVERALYWHQHQKTYAEDRPSEAASGE